MLHIEPGHALHHLAGEVQRRADASGGVIVLARILLEQRDQVLRIGRRKIPGGDQDVRHLPQAADEGEIIGRLVG